MQQLIVAWLILLISCAHAECPKPSLTESALMDTVSTVVALSQGATELNPLGLVGSTVIKAIVVDNEDKLSPSQKANASAVWTGASANNLMAAAGFGFFPAILTGIMVGIIIKINNNC